MPSGSPTPGQKGFCTSLWDCCCGTAPGMLRSGAAGEGWRVLGGRGDPFRGLGQALGWGQGKANRGGEQGEGGGKEKSEEACVCDC